jgi:hypothetical protein
VHAEVVILFFRASASAMKHGGSMALAQKRKPGIIVIDNLCVHANAILFKKIGPKRIIIRSMVLRF